jgi:hypothetical protein
MNATKEGPSSACWKVWRSSDELFEIVEGFAFGSLSVATEVVVELSTKEPNLRFVIASEARPWCVAAAYVNGQRVEKEETLADNPRDPVDALLGEIVAWIDGMEETYVDNGTVDKLKDFAARGHALLDAPAWSSTGHAVACLPGRCDPHCKNP